MSKVSFRARALAEHKAMPVFCAEELPDLSEYAQINRAVAAMPTGMEKEEEMVCFRLSNMAAVGRQVALLVQSPLFYWLRLLAVGGFSRRTLWSTLE